MFLGIFSSVLLFAMLMTLSVSAFGPRVFLKREDPAIGTQQQQQKPSGAENAQTGPEKLEEAQAKRFEPENFYGGAGLQGKLDGYYEQQPAAVVGWMPGPYGGQQKRFDYYLDGFYGGGGPVAAAVEPVVAPMARRYADYNAGFAPFYGAPAKRFDFGYAPRSRLSGFL